MRKFIVAAALAFGILMISANTASAQTCTTPQCVPAETTTTLPEPIREAQEHFGETVDNLKPIGVLGALALVGWFFYSTYSSASSRAYRGR